MLLPQLLLGRQQRRLVLGQSQVRADCAQRAAPATSLVAAAGRTPPPAAWSSTARRSCSSVRPGLSGRRGDGGASAAATTRAEALRPAPARRPAGRRRPTRCDGRPRLRPTPARRASGSTASRNAAGRRRPAARARSSPASACAAVGASSAVERRQPLRRAAPRSPARTASSDHAAAERALRRLVAHDEAVAVQRADRPVELELHPARRPRRNGLAFEQHDARADVARRRGAGAPASSGRAAAARRRAGAAGRRCAGRRVRRLGDDPVAAADVGAVEAAAGEVERAGAGRPGRWPPRGCAPAGRARAPRRPRGDTSSRSPGATVPDTRRAGHHRADAGEREAAVDGEAEVAAARPRRAVRRRAAPDGGRAPRCRRR